MANTYTPNINLAKPAHGDINWHTPLNENFDKIDEEITEAKTITGTTIDADKDWNGKNITNLGYIVVTRIRPMASDDKRFESGTPCTVTVPDIYVSGSAKFFILTGYGSDSEGTGINVSASIIINGVTVASGTAYVGGSPWQHTGVYDIEGGDVIQFTRSSVWTPGAYVARISCDDTPPIIYPERVTW